MAIDSNPDSPASPTRMRVKITIRGAVQGVGFRPFVHRLASELSLTGWVNNSPQGVFVEAESNRAALEQFLRRLQAEKPVLSSIQSLEASWLDPAGYRHFEIRASLTNGTKLALVLPDIATCPDCLREIFDPTNRRFRYPFTNCTHCGPRFTIIEALPYDRVNTAMKQFTMCPECRAEYEDPRNRRFHAQPNACSRCGPQLEFWQAHQVLATRHDALLAAANAIRAGHIVATKGIGGFHLLADARNETAIRLLRARKHREEKPFALLFPSLAGAREVCEITSMEERLLCSPEAPIVLLARRRTSANPLRVIADTVAPGNPHLGIMLPANPIHHLLMAELGFPLVATSGNLSDEPLCTDETEAVARLGGIADFFLVHNRPIVRHVDDSIVRVVLDREMVLRRARGFAPLPVHLPCPSRSGGPAKAETILAVGAHLKNTIALAVDDNVFISQHIGDLETVPAEDAFRRVVADLQQLYEAPAHLVVADLHPDYLSTKFAESCHPHPVRVQHHIAHVLSAIAENETPLPALGVAWDGTGYGNDGTIWGGEFFEVNDRNITRVATLRHFPLPGGEAAVKEPRRAALGLLFELFGGALFCKNELLPVTAFSAAELSVLKTMLERKVNSPITSSVGRCFDAVASIVGLRQEMRFEGQAAMELEFALAGTATDEFYPLPLVPGPALMTLDWGPAIGGILDDRQRGVSVARISAKFHNTLAEAVVAVARHAGHTSVALSGGCFQNRYLLEKTVHRLRAAKLRPYWHQRVPPNDGGIALGQVLAARRETPVTEVNV